MGEMGRPGCCLLLLKVVGVPWDGVLFCCSTACSVATQGGSIRSNRILQNLLYQKMLRNLFLEFHTTSCQSVCQKRSGRMNGGEFTVKWFSYAWQGHAYAGGEAESRNDVKATGWVRHQADASVCMHVYYYRSWFCIGTVKRTVGDGARTETVTSYKVMAVWIGMLELN